MKNKYPVKIPTESWVNVAPVNPATQKTEARGLQV